MPILLGWAAVTMAGGYAMSNTLDKTDEVVDSFTRMAAIGVAGYLLYVVTRPK